MQYNLNQHYTGRHYSSIDDIKRSHTARQLANGRRSTFSGSNPPFNVVVVSHPEIPTISTTIEAREESQETSAAVLLDDDKHFLINNSSPSSQSIVASCSKLEVPLQGLSPQWRNSPPDRSGSNVSQASEYNSDTMEPTAIQYPSNISPPVASPNHDTKMSSPFKTLPTFNNDQQSNTKLNGNCMTMCPLISLGHRPMSRSASQEYSHMPHTIRGGSGCYLTYLPQFNPSHTGMQSYSAMPKPIRHSSYSETDMLHYSICNCIQNQCPHCGKLRDASIAQQVCIPESLNQSVQTHPPNHHGHLPTMRSSDSVETPNIGTKRAPESSASGEGGPGSKCSIRKGNQNPDEGDSESEHWNGNNTDHEPNNVLFRNEDKGSHNKPANKQRRPQSAQTTSSSKAATTTTVKPNLHSSTDALADNHCKDY